MHNICIQKNTFSLAAHNLEFCLVPSKSLGTHWLLQAAAHNLGTNVGVSKIRNTYLSPGLLQQESETDFQKNSFRRRTDIFCRACRDFCSSESAMSVMITRLDLKPSCISR